jgi:polyferredoxin
MHRRFFILFLLLLTIPVLAAAVPATAPADFGWLKYALWLPLLLFALWWLVRGGRREGENAGKAYPKRIYLAALTLTVLVFGFALGQEPNPVAALVAFFPWSNGGGWGLALLVLLFFSLFAIAGTKLICGWGCPFGALQELLYEIPIFRRIKRNQLPFLLTMPVRTLFFGAFLLVVFEGIGLYDYIDPFKIFGLNFGMRSVTASILFLLLLSLFVYRPFCQLLCPFGWYSWFLERFSLFGIRIDRRTCCRCNACARACPLEAARGRLLASPVPADCFSCARCLRVCPVAAIDYGWRWRKVGKR